ncbi:uncharacterized protein VICG_01879 [Vittaforma corneae ATCC 50505]|uniref:Uncharacterized protein n=1 Tax=Vittaforma corneae (strain ATCC 50505) TaxID=993615 RepID=L2GJS3_VITCO|nr:uncharacterized protein VICG_01879 [Vittaforma corneae ATCC 50505]ELA41086.1 hypothetical protein VICG_01879 [Vittaforma corneae ATCC 50505]
MLNSENPSENLVNERHAPKIDYVITTSIGCVPYVVDCEHAHFKKTRKVFLDDFLYKNSFYDKNFEADLKTFIGTDSEVILGFKSSDALCKNTRIIASKRGNYRLTEARYNEILKLMKVDKFADFKTGKIKVNNLELVEPKDLSEFTKCDNKIYGTQLINELTESGLLLFIEDSKLACRHLNDTDFEYEKYLLSINEMNVFTFISEHNYKTLFEYALQHEKNGWW